MALQTEEQTIPLFLIDGKVTEKNVPFNALYDALSTIIQHLIKCIEIEPRAVLDFISIEMENTAPKPQRGCLIL